MVTDKRYVAPTNLPCPKCGKLMRLVAIEPALPVLSGDLVTYRCGACNCDEKHHIHQADSQ